MEETDLFGDPIRRSDGRRGRPAHRWSLRNSNKVKMLLALGWSNERIAAAIYVSLPTLRKYYFSELKARDTQRDRLVARQLERTWEQAEAGNISAERMFSHLMTKNDDLFDRALRADSKPKDAAPKASEGKKDLLRRAALDAEASLEAEIGAEAHEIRKH